MKRFITGFLCGALLFGGTAVLADSVSMVGKIVDGEVSVFYNDEPLAAKAITVEGTSYLPVRTVGNTLGAQIDYRDGAIYVEKTDDYEAIKTQVMNDIKLEMRKEELRDEIAKLYAAVENQREQITELERGIEISEKQGGYTPSLIQAKQIIESSIQVNIQKIKELEAELAELEATEE
jgi:hypothetical protein